jgi:hypothetical protein
MKQAIITVALFALCVQSGMTQQPVPRTKEVPTQKREAARAALTKVGGLITRPASGPTILFLNTQARVPDAQFRQSAEAVTQTVRLKSEIKTDTSEGAFTAFAKKEDKTIGAAVVLCEMGSSQPALLVAPEERWVRINVSALLKDKPSDVRLAERVNKQIWRGLALVLGCGNASAQTASCLMKPVASLAELDGLRANVFSAETMQRLIRCCEVLGIEPARRVSYKKACEEGWAPPPTNDMQRAVWDAVKKPGNK